MKITEGWRTALVLGATAVLILWLGFVLNQPDQAGFVWLPVYFGVFVAAGYLLHNRWALLVPVLTAVLMAIPNYRWAASNHWSADKGRLARDVLWSTVTHEGVVAAGLVALGVLLYFLTRARGGVQPRVPDAG